MLSGVPHCARDDVCRESFTILRLRLDKASGLGAASRIWESGWEAGSISPRELLKGTKLSTGGKNKGEKRGLELAEQIERGALGSNPSGEECRETFCVLHDGIPPREILEGWRWQEMLGKKRSDFICIQMPSVPMVGREEMTNWYLSSLSIL